MRLTVGHWDEKQRRALIRELLGALLWKEFVRSGDELRHAQHEIIYYLLMRAWLIVQQLDKSETGTTRRRIEASKAGFRSGRAELPPENSFQAKCLGG